MKIDGLEFDLTCHRSPEQYNVFNESHNQVAYIRLRHGDLSVRMPNHNGEEVYEADLGDAGEFDNQFERLKYLTEITKVIKEKM